LFAPDHFNGFFYDIMPQFCIGVAAEAVGDFGSLAGPINVATAIAGDCARYVVGAEIDVAVSYRMQVDHGFSGPLKDLFGSLSTPPIVPIFINAVAPPLASCRRARLLGKAVGRYATSLDKRVLFVGSGGLSHEPPVPRLTTASPEVVARLVDGRNPEESVSQARLARVIGAARGLTNADPKFKPLNPDWDRGFIAQAQGGDARAFDDLCDEDIEREAGNSAHEVRNLDCGACRCRKRRPLRFPQPLLPSSSRMDRRSLGGAAGSWVRQPLRRGPAPRIEIARMPQSGRRPGWSQGERNA